MGFSLKRMFDQDLERAGFRNDAGESAVFARQVEYIYTQTYDVLYPEYKARSLVPVDGSVATGAASYTFRTYDRKGAAGFVNDYAEDFPNVEIAGTETTGKTKGIGASYSYSIQDLRAAALANLPLEAKKALAARETIEAKLDAVACLGDSNTGLVGFANSADVPVYATLIATSGNRAYGLGSINNWVNTSTSGKLIRDDVLNILNAVRLNSDGIFEADTLAVGSKPWAALQTALDRTSTTFVSDDTIMSYLLRTIPTLKAIEFWPRLDTAASGSKNRVVAYKKDPRNLGLVISQEFEQFAPQMRGLSWVTNCHLRTGGVKWTYPVSAIYVDGTEG